MLQNTKNLYGRAIRNSGGEFGRISDLLFDDLTWAIRYLVIETGPWLSGSQTLIAPEAFDANALKMANPLQANVSRSQIESCPPFETSSSVSRRYEAECYRHYGWPAYWEKSPTESAAASTLKAPMQSPEIESQGIHLRSAKSIVGYRLHTRDGAIGKVSSFTIHSRKWAVTELVIETGRWYAGKQVLILPESVERFSHDDFKIFVTLRADNIRYTRDRDVVQPPVIFP